METDIDDILSVIQETRIKSSILAIVTEWIPQEKTDFFQRVNELAKNSLFYLIFANGTSNEWFQILTLNHQNGSSINRLDFVDGMKLIENYDLQGMEIRYAQYEINQEYK